MPFLGTPFKHSDSGVREENRRCITTVHLAGSGKTGYQTYILIKI